MTMMNARRWKRKPSSNKVLITGIIVGCVLLVAVGGGLAAFLMMRGKNGNNANNGNNIMPIGGIGRRMTLRRSRRKLQECDSGDDPASSSSR